MIKLEPITRRRRVVPNVVSLDNVRDDESLAAEAERIRHRLRVIRQLRKKRKKNTQGGGKGRYPNDEMDYFLLLAEWRCFSAEHHLPGERKAAKFLQEVGPRFPNLKLKSRRGLNAALQRGRQEESRQNLSRWLLWQDRRRMTSLLGGN